MVNGCLEGELVLPVMQDPVRVQAFGSKRVHVSVELNRAGRSEPLCEGVSSHRLASTTAMVSCPRCLVVAAELFLTL